jgi:outer membrane protein
MRTALLGCGLLLASLVGQARAAGESVPAAGADRLVPRPLWELGLGVAALRLPDYRGSDQSSTYLLPLPYVVYRGEWLRTGADAATLTSTFTRSAFSNNARAPSRSARSHSPR